MTTRQHMPSWCSCCISLGVTPKKRKNASNVQRSLSKRSVRSTEVKELLIYDVKVIRPNSPLNEVIPLGIFQENRHPVSDWTLPMTGKQRGCFAGNWEMIDLNGWNWRWTKPPYSKRSFQAQRTGDNLIESINIFACAHTYAHIW